MFFKKRKWVAPAWYERIDRKQKEYAYQLSDCLGRKTVKVPVLWMKIFLLWYVILMIGTELLILYHPTQVYSIHKMMPSFGGPKPLIVPEPSRPQFPSDLKPLM